MSDPQSSGAELTDGDERRDMINDPPHVGEELEFEVEQDDPESRWIVLYPEDYQDFGVDLQDNLAVKVNIQQCGELLRLASASIASMSHRDADADQVLRDLIKELQQQLKDHRRSQDGDCDE